MVELDIQVLARLSGVVIPLLVGLVTKYLASAKLKAVLNAFLSALAGALAVVIANDGQLEVETFIDSVLTTWVVSVATYYGIWKPTGVAERVQVATAGFGVGHGDLVHEEHEPDHYPKASPS